MDMLQVCQDAIDTFGAESQIQKAIEEMAELTQALCKYQREPCGAVVRVVEEMADVSIMMTQLGQIFNLPMTVDTIKKEKLERLAKKIREESK